MSDNANNQRQLRTGAILHGASGNMSARRHPDATADASINLEFNIASAKKPNREIRFRLRRRRVIYQRKSIPHFLNRFEPLTLLAVLSAATDKIGRWAPSPPPTAIRSPSPASSPASIT